MVSSSHHRPEIATYHFEHARDILLVVDADSGRIIDANEAATFAYQYSRTELLERTIFQIRHGGSISVDSIPGEGSTFHVRLPLM